MKKVIPIIAIALFCISCEQEFSTIDYHSQIIKPIECKLTSIKNTDNNSQVNFAVKNNIAIDLDFIITFMFNDSIAYESKKMSINNNSIAVFYLNINDNVKNVCCENIKIQ